MDTVGIDVVPRSVKLQNSHSDAEVPARIKELEKKDDKNCDICIQHLLPNMMEYNGNFQKNIGMFATETSHFKNSNWAEKLNLMDEAWVFNNSMVDVCKRSNVNIPIYVVPHTCNINQYTKKINPYPIPELENTFVFYTICEVTRRKNLPDLLKAFHLEFSPEEPVSLLIKGHVPGKSPSDSGRIIRSIISEVKYGLGLYPKEGNYLQEVIITQRLSDEEMLRIHKTGDCYVAPSYGEAWNQPAFDAMALGNTPICTNEGGPKDYIIYKDMQGGFLVSCNKEPVFIKPEEVAVSDVYKGNEHWSKVNIDDLRYYMRLVYESSKNAEEDFVKVASGDGLDVASNFSYEIVGERIKDLLERK